MGLLATVLNMPIIIPPHPSAAVVLGAAMLGRFAHESSPIKTQEEANAAGESDKLWKIMVEMTAPAERIEPRSGTEGERERRLLNAKYEVFRESIEVQLRWRRMIAEAVA